VKIEIDIKLFAKNRIKIESKFNNDNRNVTIKFLKNFQSYDHKCTATFLWFTVYNVLQL